MELLGVRRGERLEGLQPTATVILAEKLSQNGAAETFADHGCGPA